MASITVTQIKKVSDNTWTTLKTPMALSFGAQVLDASTSGRDTTTGIMYRDVVRTDVVTVSCTLPAGYTNTEMAAFLNIILNAGGFNMEFPDVRTGTFTNTRKFYCATANPEIDKVLSRTTEPLWVYKELQFEAIEY